MLTLKKELYEQCFAYVKQRMNAAELAIAEAQEAQNDDTKSSAGDKYETGREMMQQETDRNLAQLMEANKLKIALNTINFGSLVDVADTGSVIKTDNGNFYLAISAGVLEAGGEKYFAVSLASPIGQALKGKKNADEFALNGKQYKVNSVI